MKQRIKHRGVKEYLDLQELFFTHSCNSNATNTRLQQWKERKGSQIDLRNREGELQELEKSVVSVLSFWDFFPSEKHRETMRENNWVQVSLSREKVLRPNKVQSLKKRERERERGSEAVGRHYTSMGISASSISGQERDGVSELKQREKETVTERERESVCDASKPFTLFFWAFIYVFSIPTIHTEQTVTYYPIRISQ